MKVLPLETVVIDGTCIICNRRFKGTQVFTFKLSQHNTDLRTRNTSLCSSDVSVRIRRTFNVSSIARGSGQNLLDQARLAG